MNCQKHLFSLPDDLHYLNCAYFSPLLKSVEEAGKKGIDRKKRPWDVPSDDFFRESNQLRSLFARLVNAPESTDIAILASASYGLSLVAKNIPKVTDKNIVIAGEQFPSNVYAWMRYCRENNCTLNIVKAPDTQNGRGKKWNRKILEAINPDTLLVALGNVHWADGTLFDLEAISKRIKEVDGYLAIDATQSLGALPFDVLKIKPDAVISAGYKWLMGPYSIGLGYFSPRMQEGIPLEEGWLNRQNSEDFAGLVNYEEHYQPGALRYDVGERCSFILVPMMIKALEQILDWDPSNVQQYCQSLTEDLSDILPEYGYRLEDNDWRSHHLFGIYLPGRIDPKELQKNLQKQRVHVSVRGSAIRVSPNVYNEKKNIEKLIETLKKSA